MTEKRKVTKTFSAGQRAAVVDMYQVRGMSIRAIAAEMGCSYGKVHLTLASEGVTFRPRGFSSFYAEQRKAAKKK